MAKKQEEQSNFASTATQLNSIQEVAFAILENNGTLSILTKKDCNVAHPEPLILDGYLNKKVLYDLNKDEKWVKDAVQHHCQYSGGHSLFGVA